MHGVTGSSFKETGSCGLINKACRRARQSMPAGLGGAAKTTPLIGPVLALSHYAHAGGCVSSRQTIPMKQNVQDVQVCLGLSSMNNQE